MEAARQRVRATAAPPKAVTKGSAKRKAVGKDNRPPKKAAVTPGDAPPKKKSPLKSRRDVGKGMMTSTGPVVEGPRCLLTHKDYAIEEVGSLLKPMDVEPCAKLKMEKLEASALFYSVHVKALQDRCVAKEGVVTREKYKEALRTLNGELKEVKEKLEEAGRQKETLQGDLSTLRGQVKKDGANVVKEFKESQSFIDSCAEYYGTGFEDCLKQVTSFYPDLDLSRITMDDPMPMTPAGDTFVGESDDSTESDLLPKDDSVILAQPTANPAVTTSHPSIKLVDVENPLAQDKGDKTFNDAFTT
ncbi:hypothetical protein SO802_015181 [Lithocarpus litseifolius]|uniref:Uncharacterized protein n=1 Tax=Lithocarpus litseifolius TaxID=425828 RepID=A0AAW2CW82_9ROSI